MTYEPDMLTVKEALEKILDLVHVLDVEDRSLLQAVDRVLAEEVKAGIELPSWANSAMDGYAVQYKDIRGATQHCPKTLRVVGQVPAGEMPSQEVIDGTAVRVMTGAVLPVGADTVVPFECTDEMIKQREDIVLDEIGIHQELFLGSHVRPAGQDVRRGDTVLEKGTVLRAGHIGLLASLGYRAVPVVRPAVVAILATGDELLEPGDSLEPGKIYDSNSYAIAAAVLRCGAIPKMLGIAGDQIEKLHRKIRTAFDADLLITSAGVSKGEFDIVKDVLAQIGEIAFWSVRMRPGKPLIVSSLKASETRQLPHVGLPGNPVSALVTFEELVRPALLKMMGRQCLVRPTIDVILEDSVVNPDGRRVFARAVIENKKGVHYARLTGPQGSNILTSMTMANGLVICPEGTRKLNAGESAKARMLYWSEETC